MNKNIIVEISRIKELMFNKNVINEEATDTCQGNCDNGEGTLTKSNGDIQKGTFRDKKFVKGTLKYVDGSSTERDYGTDGWGDVYYTNPSGFKTPKMAVYEYDSDNGKVWLLNLSTGDRKLHEKIYEILDNFKPDQNCISMAPDAEVELIDNTYVAIKVPRTDGHYSFFYDGQVYIYKDDGSKIYGKYSCDGNQIKVILDNGTEEVVGKTTDSGKNDGSAKSKDSKPRCPSGQRYCWTECLDSTGFKNEEEGNKFREWVNSKYPDYAKEIKLDPTGQFNNCYIRKAWKKYGEEYKNQSGEKKDDVKKDEPTPNQPEVNPYADWVSGEIETDE